MQSNHRRCGRVQPIVPGEKLCSFSRTSLSGGIDTLQVTEPAQSTLRQGDCDGVLFSLLSNSAVSYMVIPFDIFESVVEGIQSIAITDGQVPCI